MYKHNPLQKPLILFNAKKENRNPIGDTIGQFLIRDSFRVTNLNYPHLVAMTNKKVLNLNFFFLSVSFLYNNLVGVSLHK